VTEAEWVACNDPHARLTFLRGKVSDRKLRLFAVASCRQVWDQFEQPCQRWIEAAELFADHLLPAEQLRDIHAEALRTHWQILPEVVSEEDAAYRRHTFWRMACDTGSEAFFAAQEVVAELGRLDSRLVAGSNSLALDIFAPFSPASIPQSSRTATVVSVAQAIYAERAFDNLPILADALEDSGYDNSYTLDHCRQPGVHARGCWVVDLLLGRL
jgi:hypothetical protein